MNTSPGNLDQIIKNNSVEHKKTLQYENSMSSYCYFMNNTPPLIDFEVEWTDSGKKSENRENYNFFLPVSSLSGYKI